MTFRSNKAAGSGLLAFALLLSACGGGESTVTAGDGSDDGAPATADAPGQDGATNDADNTSNADGTNDGSNTDSNTDEGAAGSTGTPGPGSELDGAEGTLGTLLFADTAFGVESGEVSVATSARFSGVVFVAGSPTSDLPGEFELRLDGGYDVTNESMELLMDMSDLVEMAASADPAEGELLLGFEEFFADPIEIRVIGQQSWIKWGLLSMFTGQEAGWLELDPDELGSTTESFGMTGPTTNPIEMLEELAAADVTITDLGLSEVRGVQTRHWQALVDLDQLATTTDEQLELEAQFGDLAVPELPIDFWVGVDDGLLYRYAMQIDGADLAENEDELESMTIVFEFYDYGLDLGIEPPPADQIVSAEGMFG